MKITEHPQSIKKIYSGQLFNPDNKKSVVLEIPLFQRPYAWTTAQCDELIDDYVIWMSQNDFSTQSIKDKDIDIAGDFNSFYMGLIITSRNTETDILHTEIIDGQQRLTTISLLIACIYAQMHSVVYADGRSSYDAEKILAAMKKLLIDTNNHVKLKLLSSDAPVFENIVNHSIFKTRIKVESSKHVLYKNYQFFKNNLSNKDPHELLLFAAVVINTRFLVLETSGEAEKLNLFKTLNSRGVSLSDGDLIKNSIYTKLIEDATDENCIHDLMSKWNDVRSSYDQAKYFDERIYYYINSRVDIKDIVKNYGSADQVVRQKELFDGIDHYIRNHIDTEDDLIDFTNEIMENVDNIDSLIDANTGSDVDSVFLTLKEFTVKKAYPLFTYIYSNIFTQSPDDANNLFVALEKLIVRFLLLKQEPKPLALFFHECMVMMDDDNMDTYDRVKLIINKIRNHPVFDDENTSKVESAIRLEPISAARTASIYRRVYNLEKSFNSKSISYNKTKGVAWTRVKQSVALKSELMFLKQDITHELVEKSVVDIMNFLSIDSLLLDYEIDE